MEYYRIISLKYSSNNVEQTSLVRCRGSFVRLPRIFTFEILKVGGALNLY